MLRVSVTASVGSIINSRHHTVMSEKMEHGHIIDEHVDEDMYEIEPYDETDEVSSRRKRRLRRDDWEDY